MSAATAVKPELTQKPVKDILRFQNENLALRQELELVLVYEAWLLDNGKYEDWLDLMAEDLRYVAPVRRKIADEMLDISMIDNHHTRVCHFNDGKPEVGFRIARFRTGFDHYNRPDALTRRSISNLLVMDYDETAGEVLITSNFITYRAREEKEEVVFIGARDDIWRRNGKAEWLLSRRLIKLDHHMVAPLSFLL